MKTPMLKRRLNPFLLISTVLILSLLAGLSVLYQGQLDNVVSQKEDLSEELQEKNERIAELQQETTNLTMELEDTESELDRYVDLYESENERREELQQEVDFLEGELGQFSGGGTVSEINQSLDMMCELHLSETGDKPIHCTQWGH